VLDQTTYFRIQRTLELSASIGFSEESFSIAGQETNPTGVAFSADGLKMFVVGSQSDAVHEYNLTVAFDLESGVFFSGFSFPVAEDTLPTGVAFNGDGTKMFITGAASNSILEYNLNTAFSLETGVSFSGFSFSPPQIVSTTASSFNNDGSKLFIIGSFEDTVFEYDLTTNFSLESGVTFSGSSFLINEDGFVDSLVFSDDGTLMFVLGQVSGGVVFKYTLSVGFDLSSTVAFTGEDFAFNSQDLSASDILFTNSGAKLFMVGRTGDSVYQYALDPVFDFGANTVFSGDSFIILPQTTTPTSLEFKPDGTKFFLVDIAGTVFEYDLIIPFSLAAGNVSFSGNSFSVATQEPTAWAVTFNNDGTKMFTVGNTNNTVFEYTLTTPYSLASGVSFSGNSFPVVSQETGSRALRFNDDGSKFFIAGFINDTVFEYDLTTPFSLASGVSFSGESFPVPETQAPSDILFNTDGTKMFVVDIGAPRAFFEYDLIIPFSLASGNVSFSNLIFNSEEIDQAMGAAFSPGGTKLFIVGFSNDTVFEYDLTTPFSFGANIVFTGNSFSVAGEDTIMTAMAYNLDGTKVFMLGDLTNTLYEYDVTTAFDLAGGVFYTGNSFLIPQESGPQAVAFNDDGSKFFITGTGVVFEYDLTIPFSLATGVSFSGESFSVASEEPAPTGMVFNADGTKMFIVGSTNNTVFQYTLSTGFSLATGVAFSGESFPVDTEETVCQDLVFQPDGLKFFIVGIAEDMLFQYNLTTPFDLSSGVTFSGLSFAVGGQESNPRAFLFNTDGTELQLIGVAFTTFFKYDLSIAFTLNSFTTGAFIEFFNEDLFFDSATFANDLLTPVSSVSGLGHLDGGVVGMIIDGVFQGLAQVTDGVLIFPVTAEDSYQFGLPFPQLEGEEEGVNVLVETLPADILLPEGTAMGRKKRVSTCTVRVVDTQGFYLQNILVPFGESPPILGTLIPEETGDFELKGLLGWNDFGQIKITQKEPLSMTVLGLGYDLNTRA